MSSLKSFVLAYVLMLAVGNACAEFLLKGRVVDAGTVDPANGIAGVTVEVLLASPRTRLAETITDGAGQYEVSVNAPDKARVILSFSKIGYFARPTEQQAARSAEQRTARLAREAQADEYYRRVSVNVVEAKRDGPFAVQAYYASVLSLPAKQKMSILESLKASDSSVYAEFSTADKAVQATQDITAKLGVPTPIHVYPNFGSLGTVLLSGAVSTVGEKQEVGNAISKFNGIVRVQNDLAIEPSLKGVSAKILTNKDFTNKMRTN